MTKGLLSIVTGNTPQIRGAAVDQVLKLSPRAVVAAFSLGAREDGLPVVQRYLSGEGSRLSRIAPRAATGRPSVVIRQDLLSLRRSLGRDHVILALPGEVDVLPFLVELWRTRIGGDRVDDHYRPGPVLVGVDSAAFMSDIGCVHRAVRLSDGWECGPPLTPAEAAARSVESADVLMTSPSVQEGDRFTSGVAALARQLNRGARLLAPDDADFSASLLRPSGPDFIDRWQALLEPVTIPRYSRAADGSVRSVLWRSRRPVHAQRLAEALPAVMRAVARSKGHLWLSSRPDAVVTWRSAGAHLEMRESDRWLEPRNVPAWDAASPQRRTLASWFWHDRFGERRNEIVFTGLDLDEGLLRSSLDETLMTDQELALGREAWASLPDPLLGADQG
ncbi:GTP-binding protein [Streptomyces sp. YPW6]|uniref:GTP-binding protein n=1 Tax=Streptomyces sp. YPW6 TaxID=2840373 RepID=UPI003D7180C1